MRARQETRAQGQSRPWQQVLPLQHPAEPTSRHLHPGVGCDALIYGAVHYGWKNSYQFLHSCAAGIHGKLEPCLHFLPHVVEDGVVQGSVAVLDLDGESRDVRDVLQGLVPETEAGAAADDV